MSLAERLQRDWWRPGLTPLTGCLWPLSLLYRAGAWWDRRRHTRCRPSVPVVVVGNVIVGGAGKTPTVIAVVKALQSRGFRPGIVSRGYGRRSADVLEVGATGTASLAGDEPLLMARRTRVPVVVGTDRCAAAQHLCRLHPEVDLIVSDDGLQHHRLGRDLELVVFDDRGVGNGHLLPAGPLREPLSRAKGERRLVLYNAPGPTTPLPGAVVERRLAGVVLLQDWWRGRPPSPSLLRELRGRTVTAAAGMAHPARFFEMLQREGIGVVPLPLPDHHAFDTLPWAPETTDVLVTEKDAVKLQPDRTGSTRVWVVALDFALPPDLIDRCVALLPPPRLPSPPFAPSAPSAHLP